MKVFTPNEAKKMRGALAEEMLRCPKCGEQQGVHIYTPMRVESAIPSSKLEASSNTVPKLLRAPYRVEPSSTEPQVPISTTVDSVHIELWNCLSCGERWWEEFQVKSPSRGVTRDLFDRIMKVGGDDGNSG